MYQSVHGALHNQAECMLVSAIKPLSTCPMYVMVSPGSGARQVPNDEHAGSHGWVIEKPLNEHMSVHLANVLLYGLLNT